MGTRGNGTKKAKKKTATKTAKLTRAVESASTPVLIPQPNGRGALLSGGVVGNVGGTGRPPMAFRRFCRELVSSEDYQKALEDAATHATNPNFMGAAKLAAEYGSRKPEKTVRHEGTLNVNVTNVRERLADRIARLAERN